MTTTTRLVRCRRGVVQTSWERPDAVCLAVEVYRRRGDFGTRRADGGGEKRLALKPAANTTIRADAGNLATFTLRCRNIIRICGHEKEAAVPGSGIDGVPENLDLPKLDDLLPRSAFQHVQIPRGSVMMLPLAVLMGLTGSSQH